MVDQQLGNWFGQLSKDERAHLQSLLDSSDHFIYYLDYTTRKFDFVSEGVSRLFGVSREEFLKNGFALFSESVDAEDWQKWSSRIRAYCKAHPGALYHDQDEYALRLANGERRCFRDSATFVSDAEGRLIAAYGVASDVTERHEADLALRESEMRFQEVLSDLDEIVWCYSIDNDCMLYLNDAVEKVYGHPKAYFLEDPSRWGEAIHPDDRESTFAKTQKIIETGRGNVETRIVLPDGSERWLHFRINVTERDDGRDRRVVGVASDITEYKLADLALRESEHKFRAIMNGALVGVFLVQDGINRYVNPRLAHMFGYTVEEMLKLTAYDVTMPEYHPVIAQQLKLRERGVAGVPYESRARRKDGTSLPVLVMPSLTTYQGRSASVGTVIDLTSQKAAEERIFELAQFDSLTGLPNRRLLEDRVNQALAEAEREEGIVAMLFIDLDHFKRVNDSLGHSVGDQLLQRFTERMRGLVRRIDTLARLGGDEFVLVMPHVGAGDVAEVARHIINLCVDPFSLGSHVLTVTPSIGISLFPDDGRDFESLLKNSDTAMYKAKDQGRNAYHFYATDMNIATLERLLLESNLRQALVRGEFVLNFQPLISLATGRIVGAEALLRWHHPDLGQVPPVRFIPVAEETGLINAIGDWVLREACQQATDWQAMGLEPIKMAVNVSPVQFRHRDFLAVVAEALTMSGLEADCLELELTEGTVMHDAEANIGTLTALHKMGVDLAIDDFGTGYSSLAYLKRFPVGKLKIDQSFIRDIVEDADDLAIASAVISMGHSLRLNVLAEGVENSAQLEKMVEHGCDMAQGYYFSRPIPAGGFAELLKTQPFLLSGAVHAGNPHQDSGHELPELRAQRDHGPDGAPRRPFG